MSQESIINSHTSDNIFSPGFINSNFVRFSIMKFKGICLKQNSASFLHKKKVNLYIPYKLDEWSKDLNTDFT